MAEYSSNYTQNTTNLNVGSEVYKISRRVNVINDSSMDNSCIYCGAESGTIYDYFPTYEVSSDPAKKAAIDSLWTFGGGNFTYTANLKNIDYNICFALISDTGTINELGLNTVYQIGKQIYNKANPESASNIFVLNPIDIRKVIFFPSFNGYASGSPDAQLVNKDIKYLIDHPDDFWVTSINMTNVMWDGTEYSTPSTESQQIRPCIVGKDYFLPVCNIFPVHHYDTTDYNGQKYFSQSYYGVYDDDGMPISFSPIQSAEALTYNPDTSYGGAKTPNNNKYYYNYNYYTSKVKLIAPARQILKLLAYCGCYFADNNYNISGKNLNTMWNDDHIYLGEMLEGARTTGNLIKGTDILTSDTVNKGEYSSQTDFNPSPSPPGPGPYDDDPWHGVSFSGVGVGGAGAFAKCYYMTSTELANLRTWMNSNNVPEGFDPMQQIIGLSQVPVSLSGDDNTTVQFVNSSAVYDPGVTRLVDSGVSTQVSMGTPKRYALGSVDIVRRMQERGEPYLDYDCQIELYLPLIGMFSLDTQAVMGRTITAEAVLDPISGTLAAYAYVSRDGQYLPIAYGSTTIGVDLPITAQQYSVARAALKQANAQLGTSLLSSTLSFIAAATAGGKGSGTGAKTATGSTNGLAAAGIREAGADYMKASQAGNVFGDFMQWGRTIRQLSYGNNTAVAGSFGGSSAQWSYPFTPYVKIIRPRYEKPSNYNHSQGVPCVQAKTVGSCTGFIQCIGVDVSGITGATDIELQAIQAALTNGVFAGGGS